MSGHNKWSKIKRKKGASDAKKSAVFSKIVKLITNEAKKSNGDENSPGLRVAIEKARSVNMPKENIEKAIKKADDNQKELEKIVYEGYGPAGVGIIVECLTDNRNRSAQEVKHAFSKNSYSLGAIGSVSWSFEKKEDVLQPTTLIKIEGEDIEKLEKLLDELEDIDDVQEVYNNADY